MNATHKKPDTLVLHPYIKSGKFHTRDPQARLEEAAGLALAINLDIALQLVVALSQPRPSTLFGSGKVEELAAIIEKEEIKLAIVDGSLSPVQQRNLERAWKCKVIDRTALILEIFGARARTAEGKLQVELAALEYQKTRLVRSWTHLERQRGGFGFLGGPGESQIEIDRRLIRDRIAKLKSELGTVVRTRELHRKQRKSVPYPIIALVGYTNAGKSTLFNRLTGSDVVAMDKLFATLDPTLRAIRLPSGIPAILSDTVGFVSDLPHELVAAFRATLEEVLEADIILHVRDIAHPDTQAQKEDVEAVLGRLFTDNPMPEHLVEVLNKTDLLSPEQSAVLYKNDAMLPISALTGEGISHLLLRVEAMLADRFYYKKTYLLPLGKEGLLSWLHRNAQVLHIETNENNMEVSARLTVENTERFERLLNETA